jgi:hypothetical protein
VDGELYYDEYGYDKYEAAVDMDLKHTTVNLFVGVGKDIQLTEKFSLMVGVDIGFIADLSNEYGYSGEAEYHFAQSDYFGIQNFEYKREFAEYTRIGIMPIIAPKFHINESFSISAELQFLGALSMTNGEEHYMYSDEYREYNPTLQAEYINETDVRFNTKASMFSVSKVSPLLRFTYQF